MLTNALPFSMCILICILNMQIQFLGESAEDGGGPRREFWTLLAHEVASSMFTGFNYRLVPIHDVVGLQVCEIDIYVCCQIGCLTHNNHDILHACCSLHFDMHLSYTTMSMSCVSIEKQILSPRHANGYERSSRWKWISIFSPTSVPLHLWN